MDAAAARQTQPPYAACRTARTRTRCAAGGAAEPGRASRGVRFRPCIDIHQGKVKQIVGSTLTDAGDSFAERPVTNFETSTSAGEFARMYRRDDLPGGHVIMLSQDSGSVAAARDALSAYPGGMHVGGGVTADNAAQYLDAGASHVIVTSYVFRDGGLDEERLRRLVAAVGPSRLVLDLSCRRGPDGRYYVCTDRWQKFTTLAVDAASLAALASSCDEFLVHGVDVEGKKLGIDAQLVALLGQHSPVPVTYAGGAASLGDLDQVAAAGKGRVDITVGSALDIFGGKLAYADVLAWHHTQQRLH